MKQDWLEIQDENIDAQELMQQIRDRIADRDNAIPDVKDPVAAMEAVREEVIGKPLFDAVLGEPIAIWDQDCEIVPHDYVIDWRVPILGPMNALVRRVINTEICRYLAPSLAKQSHLNRQVLYILQQLVDENARLRQRIEELADTSV